MPFPAGQNTLSYLGVEAKSPPNLIKAQRMPTTGDLNHRVGTLWINQPANNVWMLTSVAGGAANWEPISQSAGGNAPTTKYVVDADGTGDFTTVQAAITAANTAGLDAVIYVRPGTYTEDLTIYAGQVIEGAGLETIITGVHTPPATGDVTIKDCTVTSATHIFNSAAAGTGRLLLFNALVNCTNGYTFNLANWTGELSMVSCAEASTANGVVNNTGGADVAIWQTVAGAGTTQDFTLDDGTLTMINGRLVCQSAIGGTTTISATMGSSFAGTMTLGGSANGNISNSVFSTGATAALSQGGTGQLNLSNVTIDTSNNPAIDGAGAGDIMLAGVEFLDGSNLAATLTLVHTAETRLTKIIAGDSTYRTNVFALDGAIIQTFSDDPTASGAANLHGILGDMTVSSGDGNHTPSTIRGNINPVSGADVLSTVGVHGTAVQADGSVVASTFVGVEGQIEINETDAADIPQIYAFGVKGYFVGDDAAGVPATGVYGGVGSVVEYTTPLNSYGYGVVATRLGAGAGTAGRAAFGVAQGTQAIADWDFGLDLYNTIPSDAGVAYTTADIRLFDQSAIVSDGSAVIVSCVAGDDFYIDLGDDVGANTFEIRNNSNNAVSTIDSLGDITGRNINVTNTNIESFNVNPILQSAANTGAAPTGATGNVNIMYLQDGVTAEEFIVGAGQTIIAPRLEDDGLLISLDLTSTEGVEYNFGATTRSRHTYTVGTSAAFFVEAQFKVADVSGCEPLLVGFRKVEANNAAYTAYADYATIGIKTSANADLISLSTEIGGGGTTDTNTTDAWTDGQTHTVRVNVSDAGVVTYLIDGAAPSSTAAYTFTGALQVMPFIRLEHAAVAPGAVHLISLACGLQ